MPSFLERYQKREQTEVWSELMSFGERVREEPLLSDAQAVASETMRRAKSNVEVIVSRLSVIGYRFGMYPDQTRLKHYPGAIVPPPPDVTERIVRLENSAGFLPLSLSAWWAIVGSVNFMGYHPSWPEMSDPLVVYPIELVQREYDEWREWAEKLEVEHFDIPLGPDDYHKDNVSGGSPYSIYLPNPCIDAKLEWERHNTNFVNYLRICFKWGGFPGIEHTVEAVPPELSEICRDLLPI